MKSPAIFLLVTWLATAGLNAQSDFMPFRDVKKVEIPFKYENHLMLVEVVYNRIFPLTFIFDTGAEHTILAKRNVHDLFGEPYDREFKLRGSDLKTELIAYLARNVHFQVADLVLPSHSLLVLAEDYFRFEEVAGVKVHGILGADVFRGMVVKINYEKKLITLLNSNNYQPPGKGWQSLPLDVYRSKPYFFAKLRIQSDSLIDVKLLLDTGAALSLLLNTNTDSSLAAPKNALKGNIGIGLGGFLEGYLGRVKQFQMGEDNLSEVITNFQELGEGIDSALLNGRHGIVGNQILHRYHLTIDYARERMYLQANRFFREEFEFDKSGLIILATGSGLHTFLVHEVLPGSPAAAAGILPGDEIRRINFTPAGFFSLQDIHRIFRKKEGKTMNLLLKREGRKIKASFQLRRLI